MGHCSGIKKNDERSEDDTYKDNHLFSDYDYDGFAFVQDVTWNMNDEANS